MTRLTGVSDQIVFLDSTTSEVLLGWINSGDYKIDNKTESKAAIGGGADYQYNLDGITDVSGGFECNPETLDILTLLGTKTTTTIAFGDTLPAAGTLQMNTSDGNHIDLQDFKFGNVSIDFASGEPLKLVFAGLGLDAEIKTAVLNYTEPTGEPVDFPVIKAKIGVSYIGVVNTGSIKLDYQIEARRGIENVSAGDLRKNTEIISKLKKIDLSLTLDITDGTAWSQVLGGDTIQDTRSDTTFTLELGGTAGTINLTGVRIKDMSIDKSNDGEVRTVVLNGVVLGMSISALEA